jgi:hypothetical protein
MKNLPFLIFRRLERRLRGHNAGENFILLAGVGLLATVAMFFAPAARATDRMKATTSILVVDQETAARLFWNT